jgi:DNA-binding transcriptional regulator PaaX
MATIQQFRFKGNGSVGLIETVYSIIRNRSGRVTSKDLDHLIRNKQDVRFAITRLTVQGRIKRIRGFGKVGIEYFYKDIAAEARKPKQSTIEVAVGDGGSDFTWY